jgi:hypothetical protein
VLRLIYNDAVFVQAATREATYGFTSWVASRTPFKGSAMVMNSSLSFPHHSMRCDIANEEERYITLDVTSFLLHRTTITQTALSNIAIHRLSRVSAWSKSLDMLNFTIIMARRSKTQAAPVPEDLQPEPIEVGHMNVEEGDVEEGDEGAVEEDAAEIDANDHDGLVEEEPEIEDPDAENFDDEDSAEDTDSGPRRGCCRNRGCGNLPSPSVDASTH